MFLLLSEARYHLAAAYHVLREYELDLLKYRSEPHFVSEWSNLQKYYADLGKYWIKYGMFLFEASRNNFPSTNTSDTNISELLNSFKTSHKTFNTMDRQNFELSEEKYGKENSVNLNDLQNVVSMELLPQTGLIKPKTDDEKSSDTEKIKTKDGEQEETKKPELIEETKSILADLTKQKTVESPQPTEEIVESQKPTAEELMEAENKHVTEEKINVDATKTEIKVENKTDILKEETQTSNLQDSIKTEEATRTEELPTTEEILDYKFIFPSLNLTDIESKVNVDLVDSTNQARCLFQFTQVPTLIFHIVC